MPLSAGFLCSLAGIPLRLGESKEISGYALTNEVSAASDDIHQVDRNLRLIESVGFEVNDRSLTIQIPDVAQRSALDRLNQFGLAATDSFLLLNPWTSCFAIAARQLAEITGWKVVVTGVKKDRSHSSELLEILGEWAIDLIGATSLSELAALIAKARLMLSNNTSTMHIADATRTPSVILFAGTELESQWRSRNCPLILLRQPTACSPCYAFTCPYDLECLDISPDRVVAAGLELLGV